MRIHLVTLVGRHAIGMLPIMLEHYRNEGVESFAINVHLQDAADPLLEEARQVAARFGCELESVVVGDWQSQQQKTWISSMQRRADDWCLLADHDEFHRYPDALPSVLAYCDRKGYDHLTGAVLDRISPDGGFAAFDHAQSVWTQFPLGGFVTYPLLGGDPRKVVAAKGHVPVTTGHHTAQAGVACPIEDVFAQVNHFKWTEGVVDRLRERAARLRTNGVEHWIESDRFVRYYEAHGGRFDLGDPRFLIAPCEPEYVHWHRIVEMAVAHRGPRPRERR